MRGKPFYELGTVFRAIFSILLIFPDKKTYYPVSQGQAYIDRPDR
jgi:hypothetical protein